MNRGKEGEQNKPDKPERQDRPDGMVQYRPPSADLQELQYHSPICMADWNLSKMG
ncbi:MAG: hypothetical protein ABIL70_01220 [candidate division WOR-3 bacterium]